MSEVADAHHHLQMAVEKLRAAAESPLATDDAEETCPRIGLDGSVLPARLPATGAVFAAGQASLRHVEVITGLLACPAAGRLTEGQRAGVDEALAGKTADYTPAELRRWGAALIERLDDDGPEPDDDPPPDPVNELQLHRNWDGPGGTLAGRFDDAVMFDAIATAIDALAKPRDKDDLRGLRRRQAEALAELCGHALDHDTVPATGGRRPRLNVLVRLEDLENRARAATLEFGGQLSAGSLRLLPATRPWCPSC